MTPVDRVVEVDVCPLVADPLPPAVPTTPCPSPDLEICYSRAQAWQLAAYLEALLALHRAAAACAKERPHD